jgi:ribosomal protein S27E
VIIMAVAMVLITLGIYVSNWFALLVFALVFALPHFLRKITCPNCGTPVTFQGGIGSLSVEGGFIRTKCQACGWDLRKSIAEGKRDAA